MVHSGGSGPEVVPQTSTSQLSRSTEERTRLSLVTAQVTPSPSVDSFFLQCCMRSVQWYVTKVDSFRTPVISGEKKRLTERALTSWTSTELFVCCHSIDSRVVSIDSLHFSWVCTTELNKEEWMYYLPEMVAKDLSFDEMSHQWHTLSLSSSGIYQSKNFTFWNIHCWNIYCQF